MLRAAAGWLPGQCQWQRRVPRTGRYGVGFGYRKNGRS